MLISLFLALPPPTTDAGRTACTLLYPPVQAVPPPPYSLPLFSLYRTSARDRRALQRLALNVHVKHSDLT